MLDAGEPTTKTRSLLWGMTVLKLTRQSSRVSLEDVESGF